MIYDILALSLSQQVLERKQGPAEKIASELGRRSAKVPA